MPAPSKTKASKTKASKTKGCAIAMWIMFALTACTAPVAEVAAPKAPPDRVAAPLPAQTSPRAPVQPAPRAGKPPPSMSDPLPPEAVPPVGGNTAAIDSSCRTNADCAVKNVGNCCGYAPACVNRNSRTDPAAVQAQCQASGMVSTCGFQEISACSCSRGKCIGVVHQ